MNSFENCLVVVVLQKSSEAADDKKNDFLAERVLTDILTPHTTACIIVCPLRPSFLETKWAVQSVSGLSLSALQLSPPKTIPSGAKQDRPSPFGGCGSGWAAGMVP